MVNFIMAGIMGRSPLLKRNPIRSNRDQKYVMPAQAGMTPDLPALMVWTHPPAIPDAP